MNRSSLLSFDVAQRRTLASTTFAPLVDALRFELTPMFGGPLPIPEGKARLTRVGGRCSFDGTLLAFDAWSPNEHHCPQCQRVFMGPEHRDWWAMGAQLWVAERAAQSAALHLLTSDNQCATLSLRILSELAGRYESWPNRDNALGPTRPFFSTYLESIWLINLCHAITLLQSTSLDAAAQSTLQHVRERLVLPSRDLIASFHEGRSNRQVWNEVAILSASHILGDTKDISRRLAARNGLHDHFANGLLSDGTWYEGENYHLFAHRGLWYGVELLRALNEPIKSEHEARYRAGFVTPFLGVLPDDTLPSRRDSQYKVSIRQWRFAEWCELGIAHAEKHSATLASGSASADPRLAGILHRLYDNAMPHNRHRDRLYDNSIPLDLHRHRMSTADSERNEPAGALSRASLSWRALLMAQAEIPVAGDWRPSSVCLPQQGLAVLRRERGRMYIALEGGHTGGGHGHPDRLALTLQHGDKRWLEDSGTGSYVEQKLHWYRSTLAHFAPLVNGASQEAVPAELVAFEDRGGAGWICKRVIGLASGVNVQRTIVVADGYLVDYLEWEADHECQIDLPVARRIAEVTPNTFAAANPNGAGGLEDGFDFLSDVSAMNVETGAVTFEPEPAQPAMSATYFSALPIALWRADAPLPPGQGNGPLHWLRTKGKRGSVTGIWSWSETGCRWSAASESVLLVKTAEGTIATHSRNASGWHIALTAGTSTSSIELGGIHTTHLTLPTVAQSNATPLAPTNRSTKALTDVIELAQTTQADDALLALAGQPIKGATQLTLGEAHYVQTEQSFAEANKPVAKIQISATTHSLIIDVLARTGTIVVPTIPDENTLDNERRDVNSDGVQIYIATEAGKPWTAAWIAVPAAESQPKARVTSITANAPDIESHWSTVDNGWAMRVLIPLNHIPFNGNDTFVLEVIVNERPGNRARRRGQLILSGGSGFGYLRGDRTDSTNALTFKIPPVTPTLA